MNAEGDQTGKTNILRATIGIITRGGPITINAYQSTNPVMLKGMQLPAEARYSFKDPTYNSSNDVNQPISIELLFGENGYEPLDISLGTLQLQEFLPLFSRPSNIELKLAVSADQVLSIALLDPISQKYRSVGFINISALDPPAVRSIPKDDPYGGFRKAYQEIQEMVENPQPRQTGIARRGKDLAQDVTISFAEALHGGRKDIEVVGTQICPACTGSGTVPGRALSSCTHCLGTGWARKLEETAKGPMYHFTICTICKGDGLINNYPCHTCWGHGSIKIERSFTLQIPAYIDSGTVIYVLHQGEPGQFGGLPGHLRLTVKVAAHMFMSRFGRDIYVDLPVSTNTARQGGRLRVPALEMGGAFLLDLPAGTRSNTVFQVSKNEAHSLTARIETYRPAFLFLLPNINQRINAIREWLGGVDIEIQAANECDLDEQISTSALSDMAGSSPMPVRSTQQAEFYTCRGMAYIEKGDREHALADFNMALELDPEYASAYDNRSIWYMGQKEPEKALADMNRALEVAPNNAGYYYHRAMLYHFQADLEKALADYTKALELDPTNADIYESRSKAYIAQNDLEAALAGFNKALELDPTRVNCYYQRGVAYQHKDDLVHAIADFTKALELDPNNVSVRNDRSRVYIQLNDLENALTDASKLVEMHPTNAGAYNNRGAIYYLQNDFAKALADYDKALELDPNLVCAYNYRGQTYLKQTCYKQAIENFDKSLLLHPGDAWVYLWIGQGYWGLRERRLAIDYCQKALHISQNPELCQEAQRLLSDLGLDGIA